MGQKACCHLFERDGERGSGGGSMREKRQRPAGGEWPLQGGRKSYLFSKWKFKEACMEGKHRKSSLAILPLM